MAVETTTLDLIKKEGLLEKNMPLYFKHMHLDPGVNLHPFQRLFWANEESLFSHRVCRKSGHGLSDL